MSVHSVYKKHCHQKRFLASKYPQNAFAAGAPPRTQLRELTALSQTSSWIRGGRGKERRERRGEEGKEEGR